nr:hypothetical protein [Escherichia coli]
MTESFFDWVVYCITGVILASAFLEGKKEPVFRLHFFTEALCCWSFLIVAGALNWWFYRSKFGSVVVIFLPRQRC